MDFSARTNTNIVWQKHFNRYEKELLYFIENDDNRMFDILEELSNLNLFKPVSGNYAPDNTNNFQIIENLQEFGNATTKISDRKTTLIDNIKKNETSSKSKPFFWIGLLPKHLNLNIKDVIPAETVNKFKL